MIHLSDRTKAHVSNVAKLCPFGEGPTTVANTCAPSLRERYHTWSRGENILGVKKQHNTPYTAFGERISRNTHM